MDVFSFLPKSLAWRIAMLMSLAMLPLGLISVYQTQVVVDEAQALTRAALLSETVDVAAKEREFNRELRGAAKALAAAVRNTDQDTCRGLLRDYVASQDRIMIARYIDLNGATICSSTGTGGDQYAPVPTEELPNQTMQRVLVTRLDTDSEEAVLVTQHPVERDGTLLGYLRITDPIDVIGMVSRESAVLSDMKFMTVNTRGEVISASEGVKNASLYMPRDFPLRSLDGQSRLTFQAEAGDGKQRLFAVSSVLEDNLFMVGSKPINSGAGNVFPGSAVIFPILMWMAAVFVAFFGLQRLVVRHIRKLRSAMRQFALGDRQEIELQLEDPPEEFEEAQRAFNRMALIIADAEDRQTQNLREKEVLLREIHHRVNNNLQLIASIMNMQARQTTSKEAKDMLASLQRRVRGMAMMHRTLQTTQDMTTIDAAELVQAAVDDVSKSARDGVVEVESSLESVPLFPDQAMPLSMFVAEALPNALINASTGRAHTFNVSVTMHEDETGKIRLVVKNTDGEGNDREPTADENLRRSLMAAFANQLNSELSIEFDDSGYVIEIAFPRRAEALPEHGLSRR
ncbi:sensor histidine kinase [Thalassorhabdomicrobium marinisediminis]|uniref:sensor histidine kinase n=1 Tax=Thalassorhabdomicrobium marinisediminis TaxID=2170577 RepID=UPI00249018E5|nr:histidine kinase dimerization/phosphoacceptor domain -containing protein [Thalassorhabdomicrobium marinisediminis]